jgi:hypothetical protein
MTLPSKPHCSTSIPECDRYLSLFLSKLVLYLDAFALISFLYSEHPSNYSSLIVLNVLNIFLTVLTVRLTVLTVRLTVLTVLTVCLTIF